LSQYGSVRTLAINKFFHLFKDLKAPANFFFPYFLRYPSEYHPHQVSWGKKKKKKQKKEEKRRGDGALKNKNETLAAMGFSFFKMPARQFAEDKFQLIVCHPETLENNNFCWCFL